MKKLRVGFIGLGLMGNLMAKNIQKAGYPIVVYNRSKGKTKEFVALGVPVVENPKDLPAVSNIIITMVTSARDVEDVLFGLHGVISSEYKPDVVIDMSTIGPTPAKTIGKTLETHGIHFLDAPVTGGTYGAASGELTIFIGGNKKIYEFVRPVLKSMGNNLQYMGDSGSGQVIKMINNFIIASSLVALSEGMMFADRMGLPRKTLADALVTTPAVSLAMVRKINNYVTHTYPMNFTIKNMHKDLTLAVSELSEKEQFILLSHVKTLYEKADKKGLSDCDYSEIIDVLEDRS